MAVRIRDRDNGYRELFSRLRRARLRVAGASSTSPSHRISIGIHGDEAAKVSYDGTTKGASLIEVAAAHEYGAGVPERSFIRSWFDENKARLARELRYAELAELRGENPDALKYLAQRWASEVRDRLVRRLAHLKPLAPSTIAARERAGISSEAPLDATGQLMGSIRGMVDGEFV